MSKVVIAALVLLFGQPTLNNDSVINLTKAGFPEDMIISAINRSLGVYDTSADGLIALKNAGITDKEIAAIVAKAYPPTVRAALPVPAQSTNKPRVFLRAQSHSTGWHETHYQTMEMSKDFQEDCPGVQISVNPSLLDYTVELNHTESNFVRQNQIQVANKDGDLISGTDPGRSIKGPSIKGDVKKACEAIVADWAKK
jgi:hypothetical protein